MHRPLCLPEGRTALVLIDLQEEHRQDERFLVAGYTAILANASTLLRAARASKMPILHAAYVRDFSVEPPRPLEPAEKGGGPLFSVRGAGTEICAEVAPLDGEPVFEKNDASCFSHAGFTREAADLALQWLVIAGVWTEACVAATVRDAMAAGIRVLLVKDACGSGTEAMHRSALIHIANRLYGGGIAATGDAEALLAGGTRSIWQVKGSVPLRFDAGTMDEVYAAI